MTTKKERGKQRRTAKNLAANGLNISRTVALVRKGDNITTINIGSSSTIHSLEESNGICYEQSGILSTVLTFLKRCEDDTFVKVMSDVGKGSLTTPASWVRVLIKAEVQEESCRLQIAQNIGPLVRCMCNDTKRRFFKSNRQWNEGIYAFAALIHNMILKSVNSSDETDVAEIIDTLLNYEGLLSSIVQWGFWNKECRPDIVKELPTDDCANIVTVGRDALNRLITAAGSGEEKRERLEKIGATPIVNKEYDSECTISLVVGLLRQAKAEGWTMNTSAALRCLTTDAICVDKDVITELIGLGINTSDDKWAAHVAVLLRFMILKEHTDRMCFANDTRVAFAIRGGLIELCLTFIERFGLLESFDKKIDNTSSLFVSIEMILTNIYWIELHKKTSKAISSKRRNIEEKLVRLKEITIFMNNVNCKKLLDMVRYILDLNGSFCCRCNKALSKTEVKLCNGCGCMAYCSKACQREDWLDGHESCCESFTNELMGQFQGSVLPEIVPSVERATTKLKEFEINMKMIQLKLFLDYSDAILSQARSLDVPLYDCVVIFDLRVCPLMVTTNCRLRCFEEKKKSKKSIICIYNTFIHDGILVEGVPPTLEIQRLFPHEWLFRSSGRKDANP